MAAEVKISVTLDSAAAVADLQALRAAAVASFGGVGAASDAASAKFVSLLGVVARGLVPIVAAATRRCCWRRIHPMGSLFRKDFVLLA